LISPCECKGSAKFVHRRCIEEWVKRGNRKSCEVCTSEYKVREVVKSSFLRTFFNNGWCVMCLTVLLVAGVMYITRRMVRISCESISRMYLLLTLIAYWTYKGAVEGVEICMYDLPFAIYNPTFPWILLTYLLLRQVGAEYLPVKREFVWEDGVRNK